MATVTFAGELKIATVDYTSKVKSLEFSREQDIPDVTPLGVSARAFAAGLSQASLKIDFYWDSTIAGVIQALINGASASAIVVGPDGTTSGYPKYTFNAWLKSVGTPVTTGDVKTLSCEFQPTGSITLTTY